MNKLFKKLKTKASHPGKKGMKNFVISIVILLEVIALLIVGTFAWVETVSSIKITNEANTVGRIANDTKYTDMMIGGESGTIDLLDYFEPSGDMHLAPASSADGKTLYFPKANIGSNVIYRKGNVSDKNTTYLSASFRLKADTNADFFFTATPAISVSNDIRVSVTAYTEGENPEGTYDPTSGKLISNTKIYANNASTTAVVNSTSGATGATTVEKFTDHQKGKSSTARLFAVGANETKYVTINVWLQKQSGNSDLNSNMSVSQAINNLGITSSLTPRHVTLLPTPTWDQSGVDETFYAWCWGATNGDASRLYKLELDDNEHYGFDYNGTYQNTLFIRSGNANLTKEYLEANNGEHWNDNTIWNVTENTSIPNDPVDPTFIIETINGSTEDDPSNKTNISDWDSNPSGRPKKSTIKPVDPATVKVALCTGQGGDNPWGTLSATSYVGTTTSTHEIESTNPDSQKHKDTIHAWPGKILQLKATAKTNYAFVGWYLDADGTTPASGTYTNATYTPNAPSTASEITYYAKFKETRTLTILRTVDGNQASSVAAGTITVNGSSTTTTGTSKSVTVDKGSSVTFSATAATGYTFSGFYTAATDGTEVTSPVTLNNNTTYYARFTTNNYNVTANAYYSTNGGTNYSAGSTGGTVMAGSSAAGDTSTASVKYNSSVTLTATPASGYEFVGWYNSATGGSQLSTSTSYTYTLSTTGDKNVYARFIKLSTVTIYIAPREDWNEPDLHVWDDNGVIDDHLTASYDGATGYYKATVQTRGTWLKATLSKDSSYTEQTSDITVVSSLSAGTNYSKYINTSNTVSNWSSTRRCIWFIISEDWLKNNLKNDGDYMNIWSGSNCKMRRINDNAYVYEYSTAPTGTIYFQQYKSDNNRRNEWAAAMSGASGKSQFKETTYNSGSWQ